MAYEDRFGSLELANGAQLAKASQEPPIDATNVAKCRQSAYNDATYVATLHQLSCLKQELALRINII